MSPLRALAATTGTTPNPPFLPPFEGALRAVEPVAAIFGQKYHAPTPSTTRTGTHNHRAREGRRCADFVTGAAARVPCSIGAGVWLSMSPIAGYSLRVTRCHRSH